MMIARSKAWLLATGAAIASMSPAFAAPVTDMAMADAVGASHVESCSTMSQPR